MPLAKNYLVWNVTKDDIRVREVVVNENAWPPAGVFPIPEMDASIQVDPSDWLQSNAFDVTDVDQRVYDRINKAYGTNVEMRMKTYFEEMEESR